MMSEEMANDVPRLCHLRKWPDFEGYGFNLYGAKGEEGQNVGSVDTKSPAQLGGLKVGDKIIEVNGINVLAENHNSVVEGIISIPNEVKLLVVSAVGWQYYSAKSVQITGDLEFTQHYETPSVNPYSSYYQKGSKKGHPSSSSSSSLPKRHHPLKRCRLHKWTGMPGYGFNLQTLENKTGKYVGQIDANSPSHLGGLKEGDRIIQVNQVNIANLAHKEVVELIRSDPSGVTLVLVDQETDEYYKSKGEMLGIGKLRDDIRVVEFSNPVSNPHGSSTTESFEMNIISKENNSHNMETKFDDDEDDESDNTKNTNNNNNNSMDDKVFNDNNHITTNNTTNHINNTTNHTNNNITSNTNNNTITNHNNNNTITSNNNNKPSQNSTTTSSSSPPRLSFSSSAAEARMKMPKKTRVAAANLTLQDKFNILQGL